MTTAKQKQAMRRSDRTATQFTKKARPVSGAPGQLSEKRRKAAAAFAGSAAGNKTKAMKAAGYAAATAEHHSAEVFKDPRVLGEIRRLLAVEGLTDVKAVRRHRQLIDAEVTKFYRDHKLGNLADNAARLGAVKLYYELTGRINRGVEMNVIVQQWTEYVLAIVKEYVPDANHQACLDKIIRELSTPGPN